MAARQVVYELVYAIEIRGTGISSNADVVYADTPDEVGAAVANSLKRARSWEWITVHQREIPLRGAPDAPQKL